MYGLTSPRFTTSDHSLEQAALTPEEKELIHKDDKGLLDFVETEVMRAEGIAKMDEVLMDLPIASKSEYLQALSNVPEIVERESDHLRFLRSTDFDADLAAQKLALYWKLRVQTFEEKAFLSMTIEGALSGDIGTLSTGSFRLLDDDKHGRSLCYMERGLLSPSRHSRKSWMRCVWYIFHVALERERVQTKGVVLIISLWNYTIEHCDRKLVREFKHSAWHAIPIKIKSIFVPAGGGEIAAAFLSIVRFVLGKIIRSRLREYKNHFCFEEFGIDANSLPTTIGGQNSCALFQEWLQQRLFIEESSLNG
mmetsp:Transcript_21280/g.30113  ORF Transcript_21280/g.30113 Transcript_21280/m.30113 type:complete len:308 (+) Transcript_21280:69-992(+)